MARIPNRFHDRAGMLADYLWAINHNEESNFGKSTAIEHTANTGQTGHVRQQGTAEPLKISLKGTALTDEQDTEFWRWWAACNTPPNRRTIFFTDVAGAQYEVIITGYDSPRQRVARNPRQVDKPWTHVWSMEMEVINIISGPLADAGVAP